jgi:hypothetical protein
MNPKPGETIIFRGTSYRVVGVAYFLLRGAGDDMDFATVAYPTVDATVGNVIEFHGTHYIVGSATYFLATEPKTLRGKKRLWCATLTNWQLEKENSKRRRPARSSINDVRLTPFCTDQLVMPRSSSMLG